MSSKTVFRNIMAILLPGVTSIIHDRTSQIYGQHLEKAVHLALEIIILVLGKDLVVADFWRPLYQVFFFSFVCHTPLSDGLVICSQHSLLFLQPLDVILLQDHNQIVALLEYVRYDFLPQIQQCSIKIMRILRYIFHFINVDFYAKIGLAR